MKMKWMLLLLLACCLQACHRAKPLEGTIQGKWKVESLSIAPKLGGRILKIRVSEGDSVKAGDTLALLDLPEAEARLMQARGARMSAEAQHQMAKNGATTFEREQVQARYEAACDQFALAEKSLRRLEVLAKDSLLPVQKLDEARERFQAARAQREAARAQKADLDHGLRPEKVHMAAGDLERARGVEKEAQLAFGERWILAPKDLVIQTLSLREGELLLPGYTLVEAYELQSAYFRFTVPESQLVHFPPDCEARIRIPMAKRELAVKLENRLQLSSYADKTSSFANYELGEALVELRFRAKSSGDLKGLVPNCTVLLDLP